MSRRDRTAKRWLGTQVGPGNPASASAPASTYEISGTVVDGNAAGMSGVTITLSGDASDTTATVGDGSWSFGGISDGTYTVTPSHANFTLTPSSADATVSGGNKVVSAFTLTFPIFLDFEGDTIGNDPVDWTIMEGAATIAVAAISSDLNSFAPSGYTKEVACSDAVNWRIRLGYDLKTKYGLDTPTQFKIQILARRSVATDNTEIFNYNDIVDFASGERFLHYLDNEGTSLYEAADYDGSNYHSWGTIAHAGVATDARYWNRYQFAFRTDTTPDKSELGVVRHENGDANGPRGVDVAVGYTPLSYNGPTWGSHQGAALGTMHVCRMWVGAYSDAWPT